MTVFSDAPLLMLLGGIVALLTVASAIGWMLSWYVVGTGRSTVDNINARIRAWWVMALVFAMSVTTGAIGSILLFTYHRSSRSASSSPLRQPTAAITRTLLWCFFVVTPLEYAHLDGVGTACSAFYPWCTSRCSWHPHVLAGDTERFSSTHRPTTQWGLLVCVYFVAMFPHS